MSLVRIKTVTPVSGKRLRLGLTDGTNRERDVRSLLVGPVFEEIRQNPEVFAQVRVEGGTLVWPNGADLYPDVLIWNDPPPADHTATPQREMQVTL